MNPHEFVIKWRNIQLKERSAAQEHFLDLCRLVNHPTPAEFDPAGQKFTFEAGVSKQLGGSGFADVWKKGFFAWEYKGPHANLDRAYNQLLQYRESLQNPPLLVVSDTDRIIIHTNFTNTIKRVETLTLDDLLTPAGLATLKAVFFEPDALKAGKTTEQVTREAAAEFAKLADLLRAYGEDPHRTAHFLIRLLFCLFAEDIGLLPKDIFTRLVTQTQHNAKAFAAQLKQLFSAMAAGGWFGVEQIIHFNGGLFDDDDLVLEFDGDGMRILAKIATFDWANIEPSILGTLFERSLDPTKRSQLGAHYTSKEDILLIVEPVLMQPLRREWAAIQEQAQAIADQKDKSKNQAARTKAAGKLAALLQGFAEKLGTIKVLDPACGSGNFLYVALKQLLDLWKEVSTLAGRFDLPLLAPVPGLSPSPTQFYGIELNHYAHELAQTTVWIGHIQWLHDNGFGSPAEPVLKPLHNIVQMDAILAYDDSGKPVEPAWPAADVVIGNPPFLGSRKMRPVFGDKYCEDLQKTYVERIDGLPDLVCYWFERARILIESKTVKRAGLLATNSIRGGANRKVLEHIKQSGDIFMAWSDRPWILDGASVRVSIVGFDTGIEKIKTLDGDQVTSINPDLTSRTDLSVAKKLTENSGLGFQGIVLRGSFRMSETEAKMMLNFIGNPNGKTNGDVIRLRYNGMDITRRPQSIYVVDFGIDMPIEVAAEYVEPFEFVKTHVYPERQKAKQVLAREKWWLHWNPRPEMRAALAKVNKYVATPTVAKYRLFNWVERSVLPDHQLIVFTRDDDYFFGVLHSKLHELWSLRMGTSLEDRPRYTSTTTFETFPFPWSPGQEPPESPLVQAIAGAAKELVEKRDTWLNPPGAPDEELKKRTLTNLYNQRPTWLDLAHQKLDRAVLTAYNATDPEQDWPHDITDEQILAQLLNLNLRRAKP